MTKCIKCKKQIKRMILMYCAECAPKWEYPMVVIETKWPIIKIIKNKKQHIEWENGHLSRL